MIKVIFTYGDEAFVFSPCEDYTTRVGAVAHKFEKNVKCFKPTNERWLEITSKVKMDIVRGMKGELHLYETEDSGNIWQAILDRCVYNDVTGEYVYKFCGTQP